MAISEHHSFLAIFLTFWLNLYIVVAMDGETIKQISNTVREERLKLRLSVRKLADRAGVSRSWLDGLERGTQNNPSLEYLAKVAEALGIHLGKLVEPESHPGIDNLFEVEGLKQVEGPFVSTPAYQFVVPHMPGVKNGHVDSVIVDKSEIVDVDAIDCYVVQGNCLLPVIHDKEMIIVDKRRNINYGDYIVCIIRDTLHIGRFVNMNGMGRLVNNTSIVNLDKDSKILGPVIQVCRKLK